MPRLLIVAYDLNNGTPEDYEVVLSRIKAAGPSLQLSESAYAVLTDIAPDKLRGSITLATTAINRLYVGALSSPAAWTGFTEATDKWLKDNLP